uniref:hypothetical protein n=1 Tax=Bartonella sp. TT29SHDZB TaxID=3243581 RepID=UPI0035CEF441
QRITAKMWTIIVEILRAKLKVFRTCSLTAIKIVNLKEIKISKIKCPEFYDLVNCQLDFHFF